MLIKFKRNGVLTACWFTLYKPVLMTVNIAKVFLCKKFLIQRFVLWRNNWRRFVADTINSFCLNKKKF